MAQDIRQALYVTLGEPPADGWCAVSVVSAMRAVDRATQEQHHEILRGLLYPGGREQAVALEEVQAHTASLAAVGEVVVLVFQWLDSWLTLLEVGAE